MSEVMIFSIKAQVYILDQDAQTWSPHTFSVVPVSFYTEPTSGRTRIISMENSEPKVNSLLLPEMVFHRPSETFGQWLDPTSGELYGLNFTAKADAETFEKTFVDNVSKAATTPAAAPSQSLGEAVSNRPVSSGASLGSDDSEKLRKEVAELKRQLAEKDNEMQKKVAEATSKSSISQSSLTSKIDSLTTQNKSLSTEVEHLKSQLNALKSSASANEGAEAKHRSALADIEKLKGALKQSSANAEAWQKQLAAYQKEVQDLKNKIQKMVELQKGFASVLS